MQFVSEPPGFEILDRLATGGMAEIYHARAHTGPLAGREVVLKRLLPAHRSDRRFVEQFLTEARIALSLRHPNVVTTFDRLQVDEDHFIVQEYVPGPTLAQVMGRIFDGGTRLSLPAALSLTTDLLDALAHLHAGGTQPGRGAIVHRDLNPENVVIDASGAARLLDFGISEVVGEPTPARCGALRGTPAYMSPEQVRGEPLDPRSDLFSAGVVLWELLCGRPLFHHDSEFESLRRICETNAPPIRSLAPEVGTGMERVVVRALARDRERRFPTAAAMREDLLQAGERVDVTPSRRAVVDASGLEGDPTFTRRSDAG